MSSLFEGIDLDDDTPRKKTKVNPDYYPGDVDEEEHGDYENLDDKKTKEQIRKLKIENEKALRSLVEKSLVVSIMGEIGQSIQNNFVDQAKRKSNTWANILGIPSRERDIEKMISDLVEEGITGVINDIERLSQEGVWD